MFQKDFIGTQLQILLLNEFFNQRYLSSVCVSINLIFMHSSLHKRALGTSFNMFNRVQFLNSNSGIFRDFESASQYEKYAQE